MNQRRLITTIAPVLAVLAFVPGLSGPFFLDTEPNLEAVKLWLDGDMLWPGVIFGNESGPLGRPLAMASLLLNAAIGGHSPFAYKLGNLLIHLGCGLLIVGWLSRLLRRDPAMARIAGWVALGVAVWWLILPIQVSTVLYSVQRMAQLSTLFMLAGLWLYTWARDRMAAGSPRSQALIWVGIPLLTGLAALSKENGLLLPLLCLAVELGYYQPRLVSAADSRRPAGIRAFFALTVGLPAVIGGAWLLLHPEFVTAGYVNRDFTLWDRLLTQFRALWTYVRQILLPHGPGLGLYQDTYPISRGLLSPSSTLLAVIAWAGLLSLAVYTRRAVPALFTGVLLYLFGHAMESSIFALEPVFMHRNYLPSTGILLAAAGTAALLYQRRSKSTAGGRRLVTGGLGAVVLLLWLTTLSNSFTWQSRSDLLAVELQHHPDSIRARMNASMLALEQQRPSAAFHQIDMMEANASALQMPNVLAWKVSLYCAAQTKVPDHILERIDGLSPRRIHQYVLEPLARIDLWLQHDKCGDFNTAEVAAALQTWLGALEQQPGNQRIWKFRYYIAKQFLAAQDYQRAFDLAYRAWQDSGGNFGTGMLAFRLAATLKQYAVAQSILDKLETASDDPDLRKRRYLQAFREFLAAPERRQDGKLPEPALLPPESAK